MKSGLTKISQIIEEISMGPFGSDIKVENFVSSGVPVLNGANLPKFKLVEDEFRYVTADKAATFRKAIAKRGDIVITHRGTLGQISYIPENSKYEEYVISQSQFRVALNKKLVDPAFFVYYFHTSEGQKRLLANKCHVGVPALAQATTNFRLIEIPLPSINVQQQIVSILSSLDSKIELNNKINTELEAIAKTIYDYWFVQFDFHNTKGKPYKSSGGKMVWNDELNREIPQGWEVKRLSEVVEIKYGKDHKHLENGTIPVYGSGGIMRYANQSLYNNESILIPRKGSLNNVFYINKPFWCVDTMFYTKLRYDNFGKYLFYVIQSLNLAKLNVGSAVPSMSAEVLKDIYLILPNKGILKKYNDVVAPMLELIENNISHNKQLSSLRDWLLPMLMNGQVKPGETENTIQVLNEKELQQNKVSKIPNVKGEGNSLTIPKSKVGFAKQVLAGKIVSLFREDKNFTDIKFQKLQYLAEHIAEADLDWNYYRKMAGPYDNKFMHTVPTKLKINKWFDGRTQKFKPLAKVDDVDKYYQSYFSPAETKLKKLFDLLKNATEAHSEVIATVYAVWNNLLIKKEKVTDDRIVELFFEWSLRKESYTKKQIIGTIQWIKEKGFEPNGFGYLIKELKGN